MFALSVCIRLCQQEAALYFFLKSEIIVTGNSYIKYYFTVLFLFKGTPNLYKGKGSRTHNAYCLLIVGHRLRIRQEHNYVRCLLFVIFVPLSVGRPSDVMVNVLDSES